MFGLSGLELVVLRLAPGLDVASSQLLFSLAWRQFRRFSEIAVITCDLTFRAAGIDPLRSHDPDN